MKQERKDIFAEYRKLGLKFWEFPVVSFLIVSVVAASFVILLTFKIVFESITTIAALVFLVALLISVVYSSISSINRILEENRIKSEFISSSYHQLGTPLTNLRWGLEILGREAKPNEKNKITRLHQITTDMIKMVDTLLEASRAETNALTFKKNSFSLVDLTSEVIINSEPLAAGLNIKLEFKPSQLPPVLADEGKIILVIQNLMDNAIEYTKANGKIFINIILQKDSFIRWTIIDSGIGIPKDQQKYIFHKFFRADNAKEKKPLGWGVGLFIAKIIVESQGGRIGFNSLEGGGSEFWFTLPLANKK